MDFRQDNARLVVEEDRLSSLPDDLIHRIMSSFDIRFVIQTCLLSSRWKLLWTSITCLNFSTEHFTTLRKFAKFVSKVLSHRNHQIGVSLVKLNFYGSADQVFVRKIANYAFSHNVQELSIVNFQRVHVTDYLPCLLSSQSLKHFTFTSCCNSAKNTLEKPLCFPALTTLHLSDISLCGDLFSKCVNLTNLTLQRFFISTMEVIDIITPRLSNLMLIDGRGSIAINLIAPQLENLTVTNCSIKYLNAPPRLSALYYRGNSHHPPFLKGRFHSSKKVHICLSMYRPNTPYTMEDAHRTIHLLQELHSAKDLTLNADIVECISAYAELLSHYPSPFRNLICLTVDSSMRSDAAYKVKMSTEAKNFLLGNSPGATLIMQLPERGLLIKDWKHEDVRPC